MKILFIASELFPLIKTGGLADVAGSLPKAMHALGKDMRVLMPAYPQAKSALSNATPVAHLHLLGHSATLLAGTLPKSQIPLWLLDVPHWFERPGNPYLAEDGNPWPDNAERFGALCWAGVHLAMNRAGLDWQPDVVHCNDWQTGLVPALLSLETHRPALLFTIHNLAYQGLFPEATCTTLELPPSLWHPEGLEFHGQLSFLKGGLVYSDRINTVSPTYAREIQTPRFGYGLEGLLRHRKDRLSGILNGIDTNKWNPASDTLIAQTYDSKSLNLKKANKLALQQHFQLPSQPDQPLLAFIGRLVPQKGIDLILKAMPQLLKFPMQFVFLGSGDSDFEHGLLYWSRRHPQQMVVHIGYDEALSHQIEAGADIFLMPSRFEPCGLNQMYSQRYGTLPIVHRTGGLADTVTDATPLTLKDKTASGFSFDQPHGSALVEAVKRAWLLYTHEKDWRRLQQTAMAKDFSWRRSAEEYCRLYSQAIQDNSQIVTPA